MTDLRSRWNALLVVLAVGTMLGCASLQGGSSQNSANSDNTDALVVATPNLDFGSVVVGGTRGMTATVINRTVFRITVSQATVTGDQFSIVWPKMPMSIGPGQRGYIRLRFTPNAVGSPTGTVVLTSNARKPFSTLVLAGRGVNAGQISPSAPTLNFGTVAVGKQMSKPETFTNSGSTTLTVSQVSVSGTNFQLSGIAVPFTLEPAQTKTFNVIFAPKSAGNVSGTLSVTSTASVTVSPSGKVVGRDETAPETTTVQLSGSGAAAGQLAPNTASVSFGSVQVNASASRTVVLQNSGGSNVSISQAAITGAGFTMSGMSTPVTVAPGQSASFNVTFAPKSAGSASGNVAITSDASNTALNVSLSGTAVTPGTLSNGGSSIVAFGNVLVGSTKQQTATFNNPGGSSITVSQASATGTGFTISGITTPLTVAAGQSASFNVTFAPTSAGNASGTATITPSTGSPITWSLSGAGVTAGALTSNPSSLNFGSVQTSASKTLPITLTNSGGTSVNVTQASATGAGFSVSGLTLPLTLAAGASKSFNVAFAPQAAGSASGSLTVTSDASNTTFSVSLSGTANAPGSLTAGSTSLSFGATTVGQSQVLSETLTNSGGSTVTISQASATGTGFSVSGITLPLTLAAGASKSFNVTFAPQSAGNKSGSLTITSDASNPSLRVPLTGTANSAGSLTVSSSSLSFGSTLVNQTQTLSETVTNSGGTAVTISAATATGAGFSVSGLTLPLTLAAGASKSFSVTFAPLSAGNASGSLTITSDAPNPTLSVALSGTGTTPGSLAVGSSSLSFGTITMGQNKIMAQTVTNSGGSNITISQATATGSGFSVSGLTLPLMLAAGASKSFNVTFAPQAAGSASGSLTITSDAPNPSVTVPLSGTGATAGSLTASSTTLSFASTNVGQTQTLSETVTNSGGSNVTITQASLTGAGFSVSGLALPLTLGPGTNKTFSMVFAPQAGGNASGTLSITSDASNPSLSISLSGSAVALGNLSASPTSLSFGSVQVGSNSSKSATITNSGGTAVTVSQANVTGSAFAVGGLSLPMTLNAGQNFTFNVTFTPQAAGSATGSISLVSDAANTAPSIALSGTGAAVGQFAVSPGSFNFGSVVVGSSKNLTATLSATGSSVTVSAASVSSAEFKLTGPSLPLTIAAGQTATFTLTFTPQSSGAASATVSFTTNASGSPLVESLSGTGTTPPQHSVTLNWSASSSSVSGYNIYRSTTSGSGYAKLNSSLNVSMSYTDTSVQAGQTYFYVTTAVDSSGTESSNSNQVQAVIPTP